MFHLCENDYERDDAFKVTRGSETRGKDSRANGVMARVRHRVTFRGHICCFVGFTGKSAAL